MAKGTSARRTPEGVPSPPDASALRLGAPRITRLTHAATEGPPVPETVRPAPVIRPAGEGDLPALVAIYNHYIRTSIATFVEQEVMADAFALSMTAVRDADLPWLVAADGPAILGYAYAAPWKARSAYRFSVETSVYLAPGYEGLGIGSMLYAALLDRLRARGIHAVVGGISLPNPASVALHERFGFAPVARFREVGFKFGRWIDVGYWQLLLDSDATDPNPAALTGSRRPPPVPRSE
ncbi:MAG: N-acetyltransferase [Gemmatimonadetes bacterium]|nr:N-acetyltransferase [Gemmatimonadota bacterium]